MSTDDGSPSDLPVLDPFEEQGEGEHDEAPRAVLITGAGGNIGRKLRAAWAGRYEIIPIDSRFDPDDPELILADLATWDESWTAYFDEADAVVHLAANPNESASWEDLYRPNLDAMANVLLTAATAGIGRFVFASSNHAMGGYKGPGHAGPITPDLPPRPGNPYGATKLMGERVAKSCAEAFGMTVVALRIGWVLPGANRPEDLPRDHQDRILWLSNRDAVRLFTCAVEAELEDGTFVVVNGTSNNAGSRWTLTEAAEWIGYVPEDGLDG